ncbi:MAG: hypothetical protein HC846_04270 [Blastocatellia bacterium]|nr:hypothetical protein [Blastocatellia bacterium]
MTEQGQKVVSTLNCVPQGMAAWLTYDQYQDLRSLYAALENPLTEIGPLSANYVAMHDFLLRVAKLVVPETAAAIHFNAFALLRRGYVQEELTEAEYTRLRQLLDGAEQPDIDDMTLHDEGTHRAIYNYLTRGFALSVAKGRGPAWHRATKLVNAYEKRNSSQIPTLNSLNH